MSAKDRIREQAEASLLTFIQLIHPDRMLGNVHKELIQWITRQDKKSHQLVLLPRDHQKSAIAAYYVAWKITNNPAIRILYISSTANLATKQLKFIKDILTSEIYNFYWPEMVNTEEGRREKWTENEISVDHPSRRLENVRDPTIFTAGLTTVITGMHCDLTVLDDIVVEETAYNEDGRKKVEQQVSYLASIQGTDGELLAVGTRYHPRDMYHTMQTTEYEEFSEDGEESTRINLYEVFERQVESRGDGSGEFLWPRIQRGDGKWFGFNRNILAKKRSQYTDLTKFRAQYYNNPNDASTSVIKPEMFQYYDKKHLHRSNGQWFIKGKRINIAAAIDFAYSKRKNSDYTCIVVVGIDSLHNFYLLDIDRFQTNLISSYFDRILRLHTKWDFRRLRAEVTAAQAVIVEDLRNNYIKPNGLSIQILDHRPTRHDGTKEERIEAVLQSKYSNGQMYHYTGGGNIDLLEEELILQRPPHDDIKDTLANAVEACIAPSFSSNRSLAPTGYNNRPLFNSRFGGLG